MRMKLEPASESTTLASAGARDGVDDEQSDLRPHHVGVPDAAGVALFGVFVGQVHEGSREDHADVVENRAEQADGHCDGDGLLSGETCGDGSCRAHDAGERLIGGERTAGGHDAQVDELDGAADHGSRDRVA